MPDPMNSEDIEDVLSSIRRLVSNDSNGLRTTEFSADSSLSQTLSMKPAIQATLPEAEPELGQALLLAPAQRVDARIEGPPPVDQKAVFTPVEDSEVYGETPWLDDSQKNEVTDEHDAHMPPEFDLMSFVRELDAATPLAPQSPEPSSTDLDEMADLPEPDLDPLANLEPPTDEDPLQVIDTPAPLPATDLPSDDALQATVAQMLRDELRGDLGEKITQIVRKLVRQEVGRILSQDQKPH